MALQPGSKTALRYLVAQHALPWVQGNTPYQVAAPTSLPVGGTSTDLPPRAYPRSNDLRTWISGGTALTQQLDPIPPGAQSYELPRRNQYLGRQIGSAQGTPLAMQFERPTAYYDWPVPRPYPFPVILRGSVQSTPLAMQFAQPTAYYDWPVPQAYRRSRELLTFIGVGTALTQVPPPATSPQFVYDYPNPQRYRRSTALLTWISGGTALTQQIDAIPPGKQLYDLPRRNQYLGRQLGSEQGTPPAMQLAKPFTYYDYPNPKQQRRAIELLTWLSGGTALTITPAAAPPSTPLWDNPKRPRRAPALLTWIGVGTALTQVAPANPFAYYDWPVPKRRPFPTQLRGYVHFLPPDFIPPFIVGYPARYAPDSYFDARYAPSEALEGRYAVTVDAEARYAPTEDMEARYAPEEDLPARYAPDVERDARYA